MDINHTLEQSVFAERPPGSPDCSRAGSRLKILSALLVLLAVGLSRSLLVILGIVFLALGLALLSKIPLGFFVKRVWLLIPFFTGRDRAAGPVHHTRPGGGAPAARAGHHPTGLTTALFLLLRVGTSVSVAVLLVLTTPWNSVLKALGVLRVPAVIILILGMTYRYIHLLLHLTNDMFLSAEKPAAAADESGRRNGG